jgi:hypothetical protein
MKTLITTLDLCAGLALAVGLFTGCESTDNASTQVSSGFYYGVGFSDPWYHGAADCPPGAVAPPPGTVAPPHIEQPIATPPPVARPLPSIPATPRPAFHR